MRLRWLSSAMALGASAMLNENKLKMPTEQRYPFVILPRNIFGGQIASAQKTGKPNVIPLDKTVFWISLDNFRDEDHPSLSGAGGNPENYRLWSGYRVEPCGTDLVLKSWSGACEGAVPDWAGINKLCLAITAAVVLNGWTLVTDFKWLFESK